MLTCYDRGCRAPNMMDRIMKYAYLAVSLEAFSLDSTIDQDVIFDGYNST